MKIQNIQKQKGFTLVEIAIVLVIIGLLLGGVLKGQELIQNSKVKSVIADFEGISAGYWAYRDRKSVYPAATNGTDAEFWTELRTEGFVKGLSTNVSGPEHALDGSFVYSEAADGGFAVGVKHLCASNIVGSVAQDIDTKMDDGAFATGTVRAAAAYPTDGTVTTVCKELQ